MDVESGIQPPQFPLGGGADPFITPSTPSRDYFAGTRSWVTSKGYGWLMELDEQDEDDEKPLLEELDIDFMGIIAKVKAVLMPMTLQAQNREKLAEADFWGPFFIVLTYALLLLWGQLKVVSWVFTLWLTGALLIHILMRVLGTPKSDELGGVTHYEGGYSEVLAVIGYSLIPLVLLCFLLPFVRGMSTVTVIFKVVHVLWCTYAAKTLLITAPLQPKQYMICYPLFLLYVYFVCLHSGA
eukprot:TRINITY_DN20796_c0_g1_i1.p1 TRINITY_DN20796_c0_g1~~TRINITY_DN20796_c0_g1_i1.p1  ORF type:complete len:240 (-),score=19.62 TRINITY_DN20796_c0_g1_i1:106-825(-)